MKELTSSTVRTISPFLLFLLSNLILSPSTAAAIDTIIPSQPLADGKTLVSADGSFALGFFGGGDSPNRRYVGIWYNKVPTHTVIWVANRQHPVPDHTGVLSISGEGMLTISRRGHSNIIWSAAAKAANPVAKLLDNGNLVVRDATEKSGARVAWQSFDHPSDTLLPGMKLGLDLKTGLNRYLTAWSTDSDPSPGQYTMGMDVQGDPEIYLRAGGAPVWRTGPWDGLRFSGIPDMETYSMFSFDFVADGDEVYYSYHVLDPSVVSRLIVNASGQTQRLVWLDSTRSWSVFWFAPKDPCDFLNPCGPNGVCNPNGSPICSCLPGFEPRSPENWALRDGSDGCVRRTAVDCRTDGFARVSGTKPPETSRAVVDSRLSVDQCRAKCLMDCSCTAYASNDISGGGAGTGCIIWTSDLTDIRLYTFAGQDLNVRLAAADVGSSSEKSRKKGIAAAVIVIGGIVCAILLALVTCCILREKKKRRRKKASMLVTVSFADNYLDQSAHGKDLELPLFNLVTIVVATDNFSIENKLGEGGFGPVYKGKLQDGQEIAVKRLAKTSLQGMDEFKNEVMLIAKLQHRNLVRLLGCCIDGEEKMLVYEYMFNTSLDAFLFDKAKCAMLDWDTRYKIILGIARGLLYLHQDSRLRIIHRDLKASNILLDKDMMPKISDFGMARIFGGDETEVNTRKVVGTYGYMSPEYAMDGIFSVKSDVFSFGVLVIEIISGRRNRGIYLSERQQNLLGHAWNLWKDGNALELVDESMSSSFSMTEAFRCLKVGLLCVQERPEDRPTMSSVVLMLGSEGTSLPPPKEPDFVATRGGILELMDSSTSKQADSMTLNDISVTMTEGR